MFTFSDKSHNSNSTPGKKLKERGRQQVQRVGGTPSQSDRKSHFILKFTHQIFQSPIAPTFNQDFYIILILSNKLH